MNQYQAAPGLLQGRIILVTGASGGLGRAIALGAAAVGATLILAGRDTAKLEQLYDEIEAAGGAQPAIIPLNLETASAHSHEELADVVRDEFGALHGLVHCAAQLRLLSRIDDYDLETWNQLLQVNLTAAFLLSQACLPLLKASDQSRLIFTSDQLGRRAKAYWGAYAVSKFGLEGLMQVLAEELESSPVRVNSLDPGPLRTKLRKDAYPGEDENDNPPPESALPAYLYLLGADSAEVHGRALSLDSEC
ncbi:YciK family oxidoreductase [Magnetovirga frankeli]|nr:YciK family oxidoreductase [gamma proteobacterium SS-5]